MRVLILVLILLARPAFAFDEATRFLFHAVLEGLYEDGVSNADVDQILLRREGHSEEHFVYNCPICRTTIWALEAYRSRPRQFSGIKGDDSTFGPGLPEAVRAQLYSADVHQRLAALNGLTRDWMDRRLKSLRLTRAHRASLLESLTAKRQEGMEMLESFRRNEHGPDGIATSAPAYADVTECAVCNGSVGKPMPLPK